GTGSGGTNPFLNSCRSGQTGLILSWPPHLGDAVMSNQEATENANTSADDSAASAPDDVSAEEAKAAGRATIGLSAAATGPVFWSALAVSAVLIALGFISLSSTLVDFTSS